MHIDTHMHTQINIVLEQCRVLDLTHIIICNLWHQSHSDTLEGWQQAYISSTHLITKPTTHLHSADSHLWSTGSDTWLKYVLISKWSQQYWGSLLLLSFDAKNIACILTVPVLDLISAFSSDARAFSDFPFLDRNLYMQLNFKNDWPGPRYWNLTFRAGYSKDLHDVTLSWGQSPLVSRRQRGGGVGGRKGVAMAMQWQVNEGEKCWLASKTAPAIYAY